MNITFEKKENEIRCSINMSLSQDCVVACCKNGNCLKKFMENSSTLDRECYYYNRSTSGNIRDKFDNRFPNDNAIREIVRVIGITNHLGHYFFVRDRSTEQEKIKFFNHIKGFTFIDWNEVMRDCNSNQVLYIASDEDVKKSVKSFEQLYESGDSGKISFFSEVFSCCTYWFDSYSLDKHGKKDAIKSIISKVNEHLERITK